MSISVAQYNIYINDEDIEDNYGMKWHGDDNDYISNTDESLRESLSFLENNGGGTIYINTTTPIDIIYDALTIYSDANNIISISIIGIPDEFTNELPTINFGNYYLYSFKNINVTLENLNMVGNEVDTYNSYYYIDGEEYVIGYNGGCIGLEIGTLTIINCTFTNCKASNSGGAIYVSNSDLLVTNSVFENNIAQSTYDEGGGGIYFDGVNNSISIINNEFNANIGKYGGAIQINISNNVIIRNNMFSFNLANSKGGVLYTNCDITNIISCEFTNNYAQKGGSIYIENGIIHITGQSLFEGNGATEGATIYNSESEIYIENVQFLKNSASSIGGAIFNTGTMTVVGCLFSENSASDSSSNNILSQAEYYHNLILVANVFNGSNGCDFSGGNLYAKVETCSNRKNTSNYSCHNNTTCFDQDIGYRCVCPPGTYQEGLYETIECIICEYGTYCPDNATNIPTICPIGAYCEPDKAYVCPVGYYCPNINITEPYYCSSTNNLSCPLGSIYNLSDIELEKYIEEVVFNEEEYEHDKYAVMYNDNEQTNTDSWNFQMRLIIICVITITVLWSVLAILLTRYNINNYYINKLKRLDFFAMNHYHHLGIPIKKIKTILGGSVTLLFLTSVIFVSWFYVIRYKYDNTDIIVTHVTNSTKNKVDFLNIGIGFEGVIPNEDEFTINIDNGIASSSILSQKRINHNITHSSVLFTCENCKFNDDEISLSICSKYNETYIRKIHWNATTHSFRKNRNSLIKGIILPYEPKYEVWKNNGTDTPIIILFFKPVIYSNVWYPEEDYEGYSIEYQERFIGTTKNKCDFLGTSVCSDDDNLYIGSNIINTGNSYSEGVCNTDKVGLKILIKRTVGYYDVSVRNKYMMMDLLAEIFAMLGASFAGMAYLLISIEIIYPKTKKCNKKIKKCSQCCMRKEDSNIINNNPIKLEELTKTEIDIDSKNENIIMNIKRRRNNSCNNKISVTYRETEV